MSAEKEEGSNDAGLEDLLQHTRYAALLHTTFCGCAVSQARHLASTYHIPGSACEAMGGGNMRAALLFYVRARDRDMTAALLEVFFREHKELIDTHFLQIVVAAAVLRRDADTYRQLMSAVSDIESAESVASEMADVRRSVWAAEEHSLLLIGEQDEEASETSETRETRKQLQSLIDAADETERAMRDCGVPRGHPGNMQTLLRNLRPDPAFCRRLLGW